MSMSSNSHLFLWYPLSSVKVQTECHLTFQQQQSRAVGNLIVHINIYIYHFFTSKVSPRHFVYDSFVVMSTYNNNYSDIPILLFARSEDCDTSPQAL